MSRKVAGVESKADTYTRMQRQNVEGRKIKGDVRHIITPKHKTRTSKFKNTNILNRDDVQPSELSTS